MFAAANPAPRGILCRKPCEPRQSISCAPLVIVDRREDDRITGRWHVVAGDSDSAARCLTVARSEHRSLPSRLLDRLAGRDRFRVIWQDDDLGCCVLARADRRSVWILSRTPGMPTRDLFERVAELRQAGFDTRSLQFRHVA